MWEFGKRYGVVRRDVGQKWQVTWFPADNVVLERRLFVLGGGAVALDLAKGNTEQLGPDAVRQLGFDEIQWEDER
jgi:hypothetical protein